MRSFSTRLASTNTRTSLQSTTRRIEAINEGGAVGRCTSRSEGGMYGNDDGASRTDYFCAVCMARDWECSVPEAQVRIRYHKPHINKRRCQQVARGVYWISSEFPPCMSGL